MILLENPIKACFLGFFSFCPPILYRRSRWQCLNQIAAANGFSECSEKAFGLLYDRLTS